MKKIMIAFTAIALAVSAQAASVVWSMANVYDHTTTVKYAGEVTLYAYASTATIDDAFAIKTLSITGGVLNTTNGKFETDLVTAGENYNFFFIIEDGDYTFTSFEKANVAIQSTSDTKVAFGNMATDTQNSANWVSSAVPEPTSGLLLLLGMAGLALKRKRA